MRVKTGATREVPARAGAYAHARKAQSNRNKVFAVLAAAVALMTVWALTQPASTLALACGQEEHAHTEECYEQVLACELGEQGSHVHTDACYARQLVCGKAEHVHTDACYEQHEQEGTPAGSSGASAAAGQADDNANDASGIDGQAIEAANLNGQAFALVNGKTKAVMTADKVSSGANQLLGKVVDGDYRQDEETGFYALVAYTKEKLDSYPPLVYWTFAATNVAEGNSYYVTTTVGETVKYLRIDGNDVTLVNSESEASLITVTEGTGGFAGQVRLTNSSERAINLYGGEAKRGFGGWNDNGENEYFYLVSGTQLIDPGTVSDAVSPAGTVINMFDYWVDINGPQFNENGVLTGGDFDLDNTNNLNNGINADHALKFLKGGNGLGINRYAKDAVTSGIVQDTLSGGYPILSADNADVTMEESLDYLFNPDTAHDNKITYRNVRGLLQVSEDGYFVYDSQQNFAELNKETKEFTLYNVPGVNATGKSGNGQFFPYDKFEDVVYKESGSNDVNHHFGMTLTSRFVQKHNGHTDASGKTSTVFEFSGDDDVWIFVDGVLVADLGGIRDYASVSIDFSTGNVAITPKNNTTTTSTLRGAFVSAGEEDKVDWSETQPNTFANNTYHTLKFFYLERGNYDSNLKLKYNLASYPPTGINKVNQYGDAVAGADFAVYRADENYSIIDKIPAYEGTTDESGQMVFVDADGMPYTLAELKQMFGEYFVLKEEESPPGYRLIDVNIHLHIKDNIMLCENTDDSGVWTSPNLQVSAPNTIKLVDGTDKDIVDNNQEEVGRLFAVVLKYIGPRDSNGIATDENLEKQANWAPVYGTSESGYTVVDVSKHAGDTAADRFVNAVIDTAKQYTESNNVFALGASGAMEGGLDGMPGDITKYYYMLPDGEKSKAEYTVAYYWTEAESDTLEGATSDNTFRVNSEAGNVNAFERVFGATVQVPNYLNRLIVQKFNEDGGLVNGARFAMYKAKEEDNTVYYVADDDTTLVKLNTDDDETGVRAAVTKDGTDCRYEVNEDTGVISVWPLDAGGNADHTNLIAQISPAKSEETNSNGEKLPLVRTTVAGDSNQSVAKEDGSADFSYLETGEYLIREISTPEGYRLNPAETMVCVTRNAIYANAGTANDGVVVSRGAGYLAANMQQFASEGDVDRTLTWIYSQMKISNVSTSFNDVAQSSYADWKYITSQKAANWGLDTTTGADKLTAFLKYDPEASANDESKGSLFSYKLDSASIVGDVSTNVSDSRRLSTDIGWSFLELYQNYPYGSTQEGLFAYDNWYEKGTNVLSQLFSGSVYVQVTDEYDRSLGIKKVDATTQAPLSSAQFTLTRTVGAEGSARTFGYVYDEETGAGSWVEQTQDAATPAAMPTVLTSGKDGVIPFSAKLLEGTYTLTEVQAPSGYMLPTKTLSFNVQGGKIAASSDAVKVTIDPTDLHRYIVTVPNNTGFALPNTGGEGTGWFVLAGLILMIGAVTCGFVMRRKREGRFGL